MSITAADQDAIRALWDIYGDRWSRGDSAGCAALYVPDGDLIAADGEVCRGRTAIEQYYAQQLSGGYKGLSITEVAFDAVRGLDANTAIQNAAWWVRGLGAPLRVNATFLAVRTADGWRYAACRFQVPFRTGNPTDVDEAKRAIDETNLALVRYYGAADIDAVADCFTADAWQMPPNMPALVGREAIRAHWKTAAAWGRWTFDLRAEHVARRADHAIERGRYRLRFDAGPGSPIAAFEDHGNYVCQWQLESDGRWRIALDAPVSERTLGVAS